VRLQVDVVVELVVAGECEQNSEARSEGEEDLSSCVHPHLQLHVHLGAINV